MLRIKIISILTILLLLTTIIPIGSYATQDDIGLDNTEFIVGDIIVEYEENFNKNEKEKYENELGLTPDKKLKNKDVYLYKFNKNKDIVDIIEKLNKKKGVLFAEPNYLYQPIEITQNYFSELWGLDNDNNIDIDAPEAWQITKGENTVVVAVIDTGVQILHEDLDGQFVTGYDFYNDDPSVYDDLNDDHGTHVSGTIAALDNNLGVVGVAPNIKIMPIKFLGPNGGSTFDAILAIEYAEDHGADIINASWGSYRRSKALESAIKNFSGPFVAAAGNEGLNTDYKRTAHYPSSYNSSNIVSVAAVDRDGTKASFSNYGATSVDVGAPGVDILSTYPTESGYYFAYGDGTSMAAPHVAGTLALMMSYDDSLTTQEYINILYDSIKPLSSLAGITSTGGMINANDALLAMEPSDPVDVAPFVDTTIPDDREGNVDIATSIEINFNEVVFAPSVIDDIVITGLTNTEYSIPTTIGYTPSLIDGTLKLTLTLDTELDYLRTYEVNIPAGIVLDATDNSSIAYDFTFTTEDLPPPVVETDQVVFEITPDNRSRNVPREPLESFIEVTFTETITLMYPEKIKLIDKNNYEVPLTIKLFDIDMELSLDGTGKYMTLTPDSLELNMRYTVQFGEGAFKTDLNVLSEYYSSVFTTVKKE